MAEMNEAKRSTPGPSTTTKSAPGSAEQGSVGTSAGRGAGSALVDEAKDVAAKLGAEAKNLSSQVARSAQEMVQGEVGKRTEKGAEDLNAVAGALRRSGQELEDNIAAPYVAKAADQIERVSQFLRTAEPRDIMNSVENFAKREPVLFLGGAFALGLLGARFLKSSARSVNDQGWDGGDWGSSARRGGAEGSPFGGSRTQGSGS